MERGGAGTVQGGWEDLFNNACLKAPSSAMVLCISGAVHSAPFGRHEPYDCRMVRTSYTLMHAGVRCIPLRMSDHS